MPRTGAPSKGTPVRLALARLGTLMSVSVLTWTMSAAPAAAHAALERISPADGAILRRPPAQIELVFNERLLEASVRVVVTDGSGDVVIRDRSVVSDASVSVPWNPDLPGGMYTIAYRVVSSDGHPITGQSTFTLDISSSPVPASPSPTSTPVALPQSVAGAPPTPAEQTSPGVDWRLIAGILLGTAGGIAIVLWQRRRGA